MGRVSFKDVVDEIPADAADEQSYTVYPYDESPANRSWAGALPVKQGKASHKIVSDGEPQQAFVSPRTVTDRDLARNLLCNMTHRGAVGSDARDGDGAGVMTSIPHKFFVKNFAREQGFELPPQGQYAAGNIFFKPDTEVLQKTIDTFEASQTRSTSGCLGGARQIAKVVPRRGLRRARFERQLYVLRKRATHVYEYYHDLVSVDYEGHFALVHSRFSTNTFPSWDRAQPLRWAAHNGEINTLRGNKNWMRAREGVLRSDLFGDELDLLYPVIEDGGSDSAAFDNVLELLVINGVLSLPEAVMLMVPEAWQGNTSMDPAKAAFYEWAACMMEPWDGPALFTFADGRYCGANLDRNGLRPCRYYVTDDDRIVCASEVGTIMIDPERVVQKGRLQPGKMLLVDTVAGRIVDDAELKHKVANRQDFRSWLQKELITLPDLYSKLEAKGPSCLTSSTSKACRKTVC
ncbi:hypothetical protein MRB53_038399 [Persea americana]|nr:hypothetical protein MRB53_038399 [Persea americana]